MSKSQKQTLLALSVLSIILSIMWLINENFDFFPKLKIEPILTSVTSAIPVFSLWWPFRPKYRSKRIADRVTINLGKRRTMEIGCKEYKFEPYFSSNSKTSVHLSVRFHPDFVGSAIANDANNFIEIKDVGQYELSMTDKSPNINDIVIIKNRYNNFALLKITSIGEFPGNIKGEEVSVDYVINPSGGKNFS